mgnify:CR=1 FL=1
MKKVCVLLLVQVLVFGTACYGAVSDDVYVRKDVYEAHQQSMNAKLDMLLEQQKVFQEEVRGEMKEFREELKVQRKDINELTRAVSVLSTRIDGLDARMGDLRNDIYLGLVVLGIIVGLPTVQKIFQSYTERKPSFTLEDVKRLIEENNVKLERKLQV